MAEKRGTAEPGDGRVRAVVEGITPMVDGGRFAAKRVAGDRVVVEADCFTDGHDLLAARLLWR
ncbi:MAG: maltotransferase domain-containing protein, partial [Burkholderiales bacterium]